MKLQLVKTQLGLRNSTTRLPFRYGKACLTKCPQAVLAATIVSDQGPTTGYSGDCLPPSWFDKSPERDYAAQIDDLCDAISLAERAFQEEFAPASEFFPGWLAVQEQVHRRCAEAGQTPLSASFGVSMVKRTLIDAICRARQTNFAEAVRSNLLGLDPGRVHAELMGCQPAAWLPSRPADSIYVRHTVGLADPLTSADIADEERLDDGFPQSLEEYLAQGGLQYFKIKVANRLTDDVERLKSIAALIEQIRGPRYAVTLDGNEQYQNAAQFDQLIEAIHSTPALEQFWNNVLAIEQPLERSVALSEQHTDGIRRLSQTKPVIIDESDGQLDSYPQALELGYRGVSSKCCKGPIKSLLNAGLTWHHNQRGQIARFLMTGEDLCTVGIVPVQCDLCLVATLGLEHVERNGHHYHPGLSYLPESQQRAALQAHPDLYSERRGIIAPHLVDGRFHIGSLQCTGFGFDVMPNLADYQSPTEWNFDSLGIGRGEK